MSVKRISYHISRIGLGITFLWIGILIFKNPVAWGGYVQPWAFRLLPIPLIQIMMGTAILDSIIGVLLLLNTLTCLVALIGAVHIVTVLIVSGITDVTVRDIAILYCSAALAVETLPQSVINHFSFLKNKDFQPSSQTDRKSAL